MAGFFEQLQQTYGYLGGPQREIAAYIKAYPDEVSVISEEKLAEILKVSPQVILQFAQQLGYLDYAQMQSDLQMSTPPQTERTPEEEARMERLQLAFQNERENLERTEMRVPPSLLSEAIAVLDHAEHVYLLGLRSSFTLAYYTYTRLAQIRKNVHLVHATGLEYPEEMAGITKEDAVLAYLFPRYSKTTANLILLARSKGAKAVLITDEQCQTLDGYADVLLPCCVHGVAEKHSLTAPLSLSAFLAEELSQRHPQEREACENEAEQWLIRSYDLGLQ